jgi:predicted nucleotidyltransferase
MVLNKDFREFIASLNENNVRYLIVGGYAVGFHGYPRYTKDLDVWIEISSENAENVVKALNQFGFGSAGFRAEDFINPDEFTQLGYPPNRIDIITSCEGVDFPSCYANKMQIEIDGLKVNFIDYENLLKNKQTVGRPQDLADVSNLKPS